MVELKIGDEVEFSHGGYIEEKGVIAVIYGEEALIRVKTLVHHNYHIGGVLVPLDQLELYNKGNEDDSVYDDDFGC